MKSIAALLTLCVLAVYGQPATTASSGTTETPTTTSSISTTSTTRMTTTSTTMWTTQCVCNSYSPNNWTYANNTGCITDCYGCSGNVCTCWDSETCDAWEKIGKAIGTAIIAVIIIAAVCGLGIIGCIIFCVFQCARPRPKQQPYVAMGNQPV